MRQELAERVVQVVVDELREILRPFDSWWDGIEQETQAHVQEQLVGAVVECDGRPRPIPFEGWRLMVSYHPTVHGQGYRIPNEAASLLKHGTDEDLRVLHAALQTELEARSAG